MGGRDDLWPPTVTVALMVGVIIVDITRMFWPMVRPVWRRTPAFEPANVEVGGAMVRTGCHESSEATSSMLDVVIGGGLSLSGSW